MNVVSLTRKPQALPQTPCPICHRAASIMGRVGQPKDGRVEVWISCTACKWSGSHEISVPA